MAKYPYYCLKFVWRQSEFAFFGAVTSVAALFIFERSILMEPIIFVHTQTGDISVYPDKIVRKVGFFQCGPNNPKGEVTIPMDSIVQVLVNDNGFQKLLTFQTAGNNDNRGIWAGRNSQGFGRSQYKDAEKIKEYVEKAIASRASSNQGQTIINQATSSADELKKFKELLDMGIITQEEFDTKKKQLLGL